MASEGQVLNLMQLLEKGIDEAELIEQKLDKYDQLLKVRLDFHPHVLAIHDRKRIAILRVI